MAQRRVEEAQGLPVNHYNWSVTRAPQAPSEEMLHVIEAAFLGLFRGSRTFGEYWDTIKKSYHHDFVGLVEQARAKAAQET